MRNIISKILLIAPFILLINFSFAQSTEKNSGVAKMKISDSKSSPQITILDSSNTSKDAKESKHKIKNTKQVTVSATDIDQDTIPLPSKEAVIMNDKKSIQPK